MTGKNRGRSFIRGRALAVCAAAALGGGALAAAVTGAQGPGDYQPSTVTVTTGPTTTTTLPAGSGDIAVRLSLAGTAGKQKIGANITVELKARVQRRAARQGDSIFVSGHGKIAVRVEPGGRGKKCRNKPKGKDKRYKLGNDFDTITSGGKTKLKLKIPKKARKRLKGEITCKDTKAKAKVRIEAKSSGAERKKDRTIKVRPR